MKLFAMESSRALREKLAWLLYEVGAADAVPDAEDRHLDEYECAVLRFRDECRLRGGRYMGLHGSAWSGEILAVCELPGREVDTDTFDRYPFDTYEVQTALQPDCTVLVMRLPKDIFSSVWMNVYCA